MKIKIVVLFLLVFLSFGVTVKSQSYYSSGTNIKITDACFDQSGNLFISDSDGQLYLCNIQTQSISIISSFPSTGNSRIQFINNKKGFYANENLLFSTTDGGNNWVKIWDCNNQKPPTSDPPYYSTSFYKESIHWFQFLDSLNGFKLDYYYGISKTTDGGKTWDFIYSNMSYSMIQDFGAVDGIVWIQKKYYDGRDEIGELKISEDGGKSWRESANLGIFASTFFLDKNHSWISQESYQTRGGQWPSNIRYSNDGANTWKVLETTLVLKSLFFINPMFGYGISKYWTQNGFQRSNIIMKTSDAGITWQETYSNDYDIVRIMMYNESVGFIYNASNLSITKDGGLNWFSIIGEGIFTEINYSRIPSNFSLSQNYPNPFNPTTKISYQVSAFSHVSLKVYDLLGREVATLVDELKQPGTYNSTFSIINYPLPSGVYFYRMQAGSFTETKKFVLMK